MSGGKTILVVDDSMVSRMMITKIISMLESEWEIIEAKSGEDALEKVSGKSIDYFSIDYNMPGIDGISLISELRQQFPAGRFALLTANVQTAIQEKTQAVGAKCVSKPISKDSVCLMLGYFNE